MMTLKTRKGPTHRRNLRTQNYRTAFSMDWLQEYDRRDRRKVAAREQKNRKEHFALNYLVAIILIV